MRECARSWVEGVYLVGVFPLVSGSWPGEMVDLRGRVDAELLEDGGLGWADLGALAEGPGGAGEAADLDPVELAAELGPDYVVRRFLWSLLSPHGGSRWSQASCGGFGDEGAGRV